MPLASVSMAIGLFIFSHSNNLYTMIIGQLLAGFGCAFSFVGLLMVANRWFDEKYYPTLVGMCQFMACIGPIYGQADC